MRLSDAGLSLIMRFEGYSGVLYQDVAGLPTIGYGHLVRPEETAQFIQGIDRSAAEQLLRLDVAKAERAVARFITVPLTQSQFDVLVSFTYNVGAGTLQRSTLRRKVNRGEYQHVPKEFLRYVWAGGKKLPGLTRRRQAEAELFLR